MPIFGALALTAELQATDTHGGLPGQIGSGSGGWAGSERRAQQEKVTDPAFRTTSGDGTQASRAVSEPCPSVELGCRGVELAVA